MSTIVNPRDLILQATDPRLLPVTLPDNIIIPAVKGLLLTAPASTIQVDVTGVAAPPSVTLTAILKQITGTVVWSVVSGTATLTGSGNTRTLDYDDMESNSVTVRASVTEGTAEYAGEFTIAQVRDGADGATGLRGSLTLYINGSAWDAAAADAAVLAATGSAELRIGDTVTISNGVDFAATRYWGGANWLVPGTVIDGNLLVKGTASADVLSAGEVTTGGGNARVKFGSLSLLGDITTPFLVTKTAAKADQTLIAASNTKDSSVCIWGSSAYAGGNAVSGTWHSSVAELTAGRWSLLGILGSKNFGAAVAGNVYSAGTQYGGYFRYFSTPSDSTTPVVLSEVKLATDDRAIVAAGPVQLLGEGSPMLLQSSAGTAGKALLSAGAGLTPVWGTPAITAEQIIAALGYTPANEDHTHAS